jgi:hypothetical protein
MTDPTSDPAGQTPPQSQLPATVSPGFVKGLINEVRLAWRLFRDPRVPLWLKLSADRADLHASPIDLLPDSSAYQLDDLRRAGRADVRRCARRDRPEHRQALWGPAARRAWRRRRDRRLVAAGGAERPNQP